MVHAGLNVAKAWSAMALYIRQLKQTGMEEITKKSIP
jgi:hypothetical protein